jgi:transposase-like protein
LVHLNQFPTKQERPRRDDRAYRPNLARRDFSSGAKREAVKQYLLEHYDGERSERKIADDLGVSQYTVHEAKNELQESGKLIVENQFSTEQKREHVRGYIEANPDALGAPQARGQKFVTRVTLL